MTIRVLVTGSRDWDKRWVIARALIDYADYDVTLISGACSTGADAIAEDVWNAFGLIVERHPADWSLGKRAGFLRNKEMVDSKPDVCLAFIKNNSRGASMTLKLAEDAGIQTKVFRDENQ